MLKNVVIVVLLFCCAYLLLKSHGPAAVREWLGGGGPAGGKEEAQKTPPEASPSPQREEQGPAPDLSTAPEAGSAPGRFGTRDLRRGMRGPDVTYLQNQLKLAGFVRASFMPGLFDEATEQALLAYQEGNAFLTEMYGFRGLPPPHKTCVDADLARQLQRVPTPDKVILRHTVAPKENLFRIATRYGVGPDSIRYLNNMEDPAALKVGQSLLIICNRSKAF